MNNSNGKDETTGGKQSTDHAAVGSNETAIQTLDLTRHFDSLVAVNSLSLRITRGTIFGRLGPNGAGKSTAMKMMITLLPPTSGAASVGGFDVVREPREVRRRIGYVPQLISADGALAGVDNLMVLARLHGVPRSERTARIRDALELMGLTQSANTLVSSYSGGMILSYGIHNGGFH
jgi:ABC-2 type transport system ATP-binding protein